MVFSPSVYDCGDTGLLLCFGDDRSISLSLAILDFAERLRNAAPCGIIEIVPAFCSLTITYDPLQLDRAHLLDIVRTLGDAAEPSARRGSLWTIPVHYGGEDCDLAHIAGVTGLSDEEIIALHSQKTYHVYMLGFLPGFGYLGDVAAELALPRKDVPRAHVPAGSLAIAAGLTAVYPLASPGGWHILGATPVRLWNLKGSGRPLFAPGDQVRFVPMSEREAEVLRRDVAAGWMPTPEPAK